MSTVKVHFDGKVFVPEEPVDWKAGAKGEVCPQLSEEEIVKRVPQLGFLKGKIWISDDFKEPLEDFKDSM